MLSFFGYRARSVLPRVDDLDAIRVAIGCIPCGQRSTSRMCDCRDLSVDLADRSPQPHAVGADCRKGDGRRSIEGQESRPKILREHGVYGCPQVLLSPAVGEDGDSEEDFGLSHRCREKERVGLILHPFHHPLIGYRSH